MKNSEVVLIVEDDLTIASMLYQLLKFSGFDVLRARNGEEALQQIEMERPDVVVLDIFMPKMDGWEVCHRLKSNPKTQQIPIIIYSIIYQRKDIEKGKELGADLYISKEKDATEVLEAINRLVGI